MNSCAYSGTRRAMDHNTSESFETRVQISPRRSKGGVLMIYTPEDDEACGEEPVISVSAVMKDKKTVQSSSKPSLEDKPFRHHHGGNNLVTKWWSDEKRPKRDSSSRFQPLLKSGANSSVPCQKSSIAASRSNSNRSNTDNETQQSIALLQIMLKEIPKDHAPILQPQAPILQPQAPSSPTNSNLRNSSMPTGVRRSNSDPCVARNEKTTSLHRNAAKEYTRPLSNSDPCLARKNEMTSRFREDYHSPYQRQQARQVGDKTDDGCKSVNTRVLDVEKPSHFSVKMDNVRRHIVLNSPSFSAGRNSIASMKTPGFWLSWTSGTTQDCANRGYLTSSTLPCAQLPSQPGPPTVTPSQSGNCEMLPTGVLAPSPDSGVKEKTKLTGSPSCMETVRHLTAEKPGPDLDRIPLKLRETGVKEATTTEVSTSSLENCNGNKSPSTQKQPSDTCFQINPDVRIKASELPATYFDDLFDIMATEETQENNNNLDSNVPASLKKDDKEESPSATDLPLSHPATSHATQEKPQPEVKIAPAKSTEVQEVSNAGTVGTPKTSTVDNGHGAAKISPTRSEGNPADNSVPKSNIQIESSKIKEQRKGNQADNKHGSSNSSHSKKHDSTRSTKTDVKRGNNKREAESCPKEKQAQEVDKSKSACSTAVKPKHHSAKKHPNAQEEKTGAQQLSGAKNQSPSASSAKVGKSKSSKSDKTSSELSRKSSIDEKDNKHQKKVSKSDSLPPSKTKEPTETEQSKPAKTKAEGMKDAGNAKKSSSRENKKPLEETNTQQSKPAKTKAEGMRDADHTEKSSACENKKSIEPTLSSKTSTHLSNAEGKEIKHKGEVKTSSKSTKKHRSSKKPNSIPAKQESSYQSSDKKQDRGTIKDPRKVEKSKSLTENTGSNVKGTGDETSSTPKKRNTSLPASRTPSATSASKTKQLERSKSLIMTRACSSSTESSSSLAKSAQDVNQKNLDKAISVNATETQKLCSEVEAIKPARNPRKQKHITRNDLDSTDKKNAKATRHSLKTTEVASSKTSTKTSSPQMKGPSVDTELSTPVDEKSTQLVPKSKKLTFTAKSKVVAIRRKRGKSGKTRFTRRKVSSVTSKHPTSKPAEIEAEVDESSNPKSNEQENPTSSCLAGAKVEVIKQASETSYKKKSGMKTSDVASKETSHRYLDSNQGSKKEQQTDRKKHARESKSSDPPVEKQSIRVSPRFKNNPSHTSGKVVKCKLNSNVEKVKSSNLIGKNSFLKKSDLTGKETEDDKNLASPLFSDSQTETTLEERQAPAPKNNKRGLGRDGENIKIKSKRMRLESETAHVKQDFSPETGKSPRGRRAKLVIIDTPEPRKCGRPRKIEAAHPPRKVGRPKKKANDAEGPLKIGKGGSDVPNSGKPSVKARNTKEAKDAGGINSALGNTNATKKSNSTRVASRGTMSKRILDKAKNRRWFKYDPKDYSLNRRPLRSNSTKLPSLFKDSPSKKPKKTKVDRIQMPVMQSFEQSTGMPEQLLDQTAVHRAKLVDGSVQTEQVASPKSSCSIGTQTEPTFEVPMVAPQKTSKSISTQTETIHEEIKEILTVEIDSIESDENTSKLKSGETSPRDTSNKHLQELNEMTEAPKKAEDLPITGKTLESLSESCSPDEVSADEGSKTDVLVKMASSSQHLTKGGSNEQNDKVATASKTTDMDQTAEDQSENKKRPLTSDEGSVEIPKSKRMCLDNYDSINVLPDDKSLSTEDGESTCIDETMVPANTYDAEQSQEASTGDVKVAAALPNIESSSDIKKQTHKATSPSKTNLAKCPPVCNDMRTSKPDDVDLEIIAVLPRTNVRKPCPKSGKNTKTVTPSCATTQSLKNCPTNSSTPQKKCVQHAINSENPSTDTRNNIESAGKTNEIRTPQAAACSATNALKSKAGTTDVRPNDAPESVNQPKDTSQMASTNDKGSFKLKSPVLPSNQSKLETSATAKISSSPLPAKEQKAVDADINTNSNVGKSADKLDVASFSKIINGTPSSEAVADGEKTTSEAAAPRAVAHPKNVAASKGDSNASIVPSNSKPPAKEVELGDKNIKTPDSGASPNSQTGTIHKPTCASSPATENKESASVISKDNGSSNQKGKQTPSSVDKSKKELTSTKSSIQLNVTKVSPSSLVGNRSSNPNGARFQTTARTNLRNPSSQHRYMPNHALFPQGNPYPQYSGYSAWLQQSRNGPAPWYHPPNYYQVGASHARFPRFAPFYDNRPYSEEDSWDSYYYRD